MKKAFLSLLWCLVFSPLYAEPCSIVSPQDVLSCALQNHPDIQRAQAQMAQRDALQKSAAQRPNPELDAESSFSDAQDRIQAAYLHTFELGDKRRRRMERARIEGDALAITLQKTQEDVALQTVTNLYRLGHIQAELKTVEEALGAFGKILKQYRARARLTPEQQVSLNVFSMAQGDYELRKSSLLQNQKELRISFELTTGQNFEAVLSVLPPRKTDWPELADLTLSTATAVRREAEAAASLARTRADAARSESRPDLKAGPLAELEYGQGQSAQGYGAALSLSLPLYQRNEGRRALAEAEMKWAETNLALRDKELQTELEQRRQIYALAVESLQKTPSVAQMEEKHETMESLFERGLIESSLIIEAHRQMVEFTERQNAQELRAIEALWSIYALQGRILREKL
ncbi:MAG: TolC family protein [Elusimicrobia bacterium]|nr:TolC family protein [Elusimicrobiota bacterium]